MTQSNIKIAITGGIGSGKSTVAEIIAGAGYSIISCDEVYSQLLNNENFLAKLHDFSEAFNSDGKLDRHKLSQLVFSDRQKLEKLNNITHTEIIKEVMHQASGEGVFFCEVPLLFECGFENYFDKVIVVLREKTQRVNAVKKRSNLSEQDVILRINNQFNYDNDTFEKYYVIHNNSNLQDLRNNTLELIKKLEKDLF